MAWSRKCMLLGLVLLKVGLGWSFGSSGGAEPAACPSGAAPECELGANDHHFLLQNQLHLMFGETDDSGRFQPPPSRAPQVHVAYASDADGLHEGLLASMLSLTANLAAPADATIHLIVSPFAVVQAQAQGFLQRFRKLQRTRGGSGADADVQVQAQRPSCTQKYAGGGQNSVQPRLSAHATAAFTRLCLAEILPRVSRVVFIDSDTIIQGDIGRLFRTDMTHALGAVLQRAETFQSQYLQYGTEPDLLHLVSDANVKIFNSGVLLLDLEKWRSQGIASSLENWAKLVRFPDDQLFLNLEFNLHRGFDVLDPTWNLYNLGLSDDNAPLYSSSEIQQAQILHWSGEGKPWLSSYHGRYGHLYDGPSRNALLVTMRSPSDLLPLDLMLSHQARMLGGGRRIAAVRVLNNHQPWSNASKAGAKGRGMWDDNLAINFEDVSYSRLGDAKFLSRFFTMEAGARVSDLVSLVDDHGVDGKQMASNFLGMLHFLDACSSSDEHIQLCVYLDSDIFLHPGRQGLLDLAPQLFALDPSFISLQPPSICNPGSDWTGRPVQEAAQGPVGPDKCTVGGASFESSRYMVVNRTRLVRALPLPVPPGSFPDWFEKLWSKSGGPRSHGKIVCDGLSFAIHPPTPRFGGPGVEELLGALAKAANRRGPATLARRTGEGWWTANEPEASAEAYAGAQVLIQRLEAGRTAVDAANFCEDMRPDWGRIAQGDAW